MSLSLRQISDQAPLLRQATTLADLGRGGPPRAVTPAAPVRARAPASRRVVTPRLEPRATEVRVTRGVVTTGYQVAL